MPIANHLPRLRPWIVLLPLALAAPGCGGEPVTRESLAKARQRWAQAGVKNYNLEWTTSGKTRAFYRVTVRDGEVRSVEQVLPDGRVITLHPGQPKYFGVDGLFLTIAEEYAMLRTDRPFGQPKGTKAVLLFTLDPKYGYPRSYRRDLVGAPLPVAIDVVSFTPDPPEGRPPGP